ncbi:MAG: cupin domain-containing protein [Clostridia bacterium]|nr:cupin domain-containing protein [Clostridia bacterium]
MKRSKIEDFAVSHKCEHENYECYCREFVPFAAAKNTIVGIYEIPTMKSSYPYHHKNKETFYIIGGEGILKTPSGERQVVTGDLLFFPTGSEGAHKLTNCSETENLIYIDFDVVHDIDIAVYPDSDKIGIWGMGVNKIYPQSSDVEFYGGE